MLSIMWNCPGNWSRRLSIKLKLSRHLIYAIFYYWNCQVIGIVQKMDFGDHLLLGTVWAICFECCPWTGIVWIIEQFNLGDGQQIGIVPTIDFGCWFTNLRGIVRTIDFGGCKLVGVVRTIYFIGRPRLNSRETSGPCTFWLYTSRHLSLNRC